MTNKVFLLQLTVTCMLASFPGSPNLFNVREKKRGEPGTQNHATDIETVNRIYHGSSME